MITYTILVRYIFTYIIGNDNLIIFLSTNLILYFII